MISRIIEIAAQVVGVLASLVYAVERPGEGAAKKAEVIAAAQAIILALPLPGWVKVLFANATVLGVIVDLLVSVLNRTGWFDADGSAPAPSPS